MLFSLVIPVYNRPEEVRELLESLCTQTLDNTCFEVIVIEDGSTVKCEEVCRSFEKKLALRYHYKQNSGPGMSRNAGVAMALGTYALILDSDVVLPEHYLANIKAELDRKPCDAFGGPDCSHPNFTATQKAISYSMTSFFTTGGIRGGKKKLDKFYPRSFNMGIKTSVYNVLGGFSNMRFGEDIDFSIRIFKGGYSCRLFPEAWVWHKRRTDFKKFFKQVYNSGIARINLYKKYPDSLKMVHLLPTVFTLGCLGLVLMSLVLLNVLPMSLILLYSLLIFIDASFQNKSVKIGFLAVIASFVQLFGYGLGFIKAWYKRCLCGKGAFNAYEKNFYQ